MRDTNTPVSFKCLKRDNAVSFFFFLILKNNLQIKRSSSCVDIRPNLLLINPFLRVKELSSTFGQVDKLEKVKKEMEQTVLSLETK